MRKRKASPNWAISPFLERTSPIELKFDMQKLEVLIQLSTRVPDLVPPPSPGLLAPEVT